MTPGETVVEIETKSAESRSRFRPIMLREGSVANEPLCDSRYRVDYYEDEPMPESDGVNPLQIQQCCVMLEEVEATGKKPVPLDWFRDDALLHSYKFDWLGSAEFRQRVIDKAIEAGAMRLGRVPDISEIDAPVTTIERVRVELPKNGERFNPIVVRGEPVSVSMMRDRGRF